MTYSESQLNTMINICKFVGALGIGLLITSLVYTYVTHPTPPDGWEEIPSRAWMRENTSKEPQSVLCIKDDKYKDRVSCVGTTESGRMIPFYCKWEKNRTICVHAAYLERE